MPTFLHAADIHLDSPLSGLDRKDTEGRFVERIRGASRKAFVSLIDAALEKKVAFVLLAGDLYDTRPKLPTYLFFQQQVQRLAVAGIPVAIVQGNHDHAGVAPSSAELPPGVHVFKHDAPSSIEIVPGVHVHGQSYPAQETDKNLSDHYPPAIPGALNIGLLHTALNGHSGEHKNYAPSSVPGLANRGYQYWALGHVHAPTHIEQDGVHIVYPGNLQGRHAKETGPKGAMFVEYEGRKIVGKPTHAAFDDVRWHHVVVEAASLPADTDPIAAIAHRVNAQTADTRESRKLAATRLTIRGIAHPNLLDLGEDAITERITAKLFHDPSLFLERVSIEIQPAPANLQEGERQLVELARALADDEHARRELAALDGDLRKKLAAADPDRTNEDWFRSTQPVLDRDAASARLDAALSVIRDRMRGLGGKR